MYFNDKKNSTNIDHEFKQDKNVLGDIMFSFLWHILVTQNVL